MSKQREKKVIDNNNYTKEEAEEIFADYSKSISKIKSIEAEMEKQITAIREKYHDKITALVTIKDEAFEKLHIFASQNVELFESKKSLDLTHGRIGFRTGTPKLKTLPKFTWERVVDKLEQYLPDFVRTKKEADRQGLLDSRDNIDVNKLFDKIGVEVVQDESFFVEPKTEEVAA